MYINKLALNQIGDTIIEVMVTLALLGLALSISYATARRSLLNTRQAHENNLATELAQTESEALFFLAPNSTPSNLIAATNLFSQDTPFCIPDLTSASPINTVLSNCTVDTNGNYGAGNLYSIQIYNCDSSILKLSAPCLGLNHPGPSADVFVIQVTWPDVLGQGTDSVTLTDREHYKI
ncbi:MAG TPA: hypothetical protein VLF63_02480 [Patescibacteria group bacterium]|nr:hypothetical protein [Patescibacteria group bacterium]